jgi:signal transduction histidine kinase/CheY-like chemotaxis protein
MPGSAFRSKLLLRQLRNAFGPVRTAELVAAGRLEKSDADLDPLRQLLSLVDDSYMQYERDLELRLRSLEISSEELNEAIRRTEQANQAKSAFLANMSHEIRTPMNGIMGMLELVDRFALDPAAQRYVALARASADTLLYLLNEILDYSKVESGRLELEAIAFNPRALIEDLVDMLEPGARKKNVGFHLRIASHLPAALVGDPTRLRQIIGNLVTNAIKFTAQGKVEIEVDARAGVDDGTELTVRVSDTGIGITDDMRAAIFQPFTQGDSSTTRRFGGTGLGLAICAQLAAAMKGSLTVDSVPGSGSVFAFRAVFLRPADDGEGLPKPAPAAARTSLEAVRVLLVEDNPVNQVFAETLLTQAGALVIVAQDGIEAIERFEQNPVDVILMDMQMPRLDGLEATAAIRQREAASGAAAVPIIGLTANTMPGDAESCLAAGMTDYLSKPVQAATLFGAILSALGRA